METSLKSQVQELESANYRWLMAREILGQDFITPAEITHHRPGLSCSGWQRRLGGILPTQADLEWCREWGMFLVPSLGHQINFSTFFSEAVWAKIQQSSPEINLGLGWLALTKKPLPNSFSLDWDSQSQRLPESMVAPNLCEILWAIWVYRTVRHLRLLESLYVRATSTTVVGYAEALPNQEAIVGLYVDTCRPQDEFSGLGLLGARWFL